MSSTRLEHKMSTCLVLDICIKISHVEHSKVDIFSGRSRMGVTARLAYIPPAEEEIIFQDDNRFTNGRWADGIDMIKVAPLPLY